MPKIRNTLTPAEAAEIADTVYDVQDGSDTGKIFQDTDLAKKYNFSGDTENSGIFSAKSGVFEFKSKTGFGVIAKGIGSLYKNDAVIVCRGTASSYDALTDLNVGLQTSLTGHLVHAGFNRTFNGFAREIIRYINTYQPKRIHCVGHSLGGALASLAAALAVRKGVQVSLYTFGCPRVGQNNFANYLSSSNLCGVENIHRVYHAGDPVAMLPLWPFVHAPQPYGECYVGKFIEFNPLQHLMAGYLKSVDGQSWESLTKDHPSWDNHVIDWVTSDKVGQYYGFNFYNLTMAMKAIKIAIKEIVSSVLVPVNLIGTAGATVLDQLSMLLDKAAKVSTESESFIMGILRKIMRMLGMTVQQGQNLTHALIRFVLGRLMSMLKMSAGMALQIGRVVV